jgi:hypothetical protein
LTKAQGYNANLRYEWTSSSCDEELPFVCQSNSIQPTLDTVQVEDYGRMKATALAIGISLLIFVTITGVILYRQCRKKKEPEVEVESVDDSGDVELEAANFNEDTAL